jgi:hypothetical protein
MVISLHLRRRGGAGLLRRLKTARQLRSKVVEVGFPKGKTDSKIVERAVYNEFGTEGSGKGFSTPRGGGFGGPIPERPFMRNSLRNNRGKYQARLRAAAREILRSKDPEATMLQALRRLGHEAQSDIQAEIVTLTTPANSPLTIELKGSSKPLIDSGRMHQAVTFIVGERGE